MSSFKELLQSVYYAVEGLKIAFVEERNFRIELACAALVLLASWFFSVSRLEFITILFAIGFVLTAELFNTALEAFADTLVPTHNLHIGKMKDISAAAVLVACITAFCVGVTIFVPRFIELLF